MFDGLSKEDELADEEDDAKAQAKAKAQSKRKAKANAKDAELHIAGTSLEALAATAKPFVALRPRGLER